MATGFLEATIPFDLGATLLRTATIAKGSSPTRVPNTLDGFRRLTSLGQGTSIPRYLFFFRVILTLKSTSSALSRQLLGMFFLQEPVVRRHCGLRWIHRLASQRPHRPAVTTSVGRGEGSKPPPPSVNSKRFHVTLFGTCILRPKSRKATSTQS